MALTAAPPKEDPRPALRLLSPPDPPEDRERDEAIAWFSRRVRWERWLDAVRVRHAGEGGRAK